MYELGVNCEFLASHFLIGGDFGEENEPHPHAFRLEVVLRGPCLNHHQYLIDIDEVKRALKAQGERYRHKLLNDFEEFKGLNPSLEVFARLLHKRILSSIKSDSALCSLKVKLWEDGEAYASYEQEL